MGRVTGHRDSRAETGRDPGYQPPRPLGFLQCTTARGGTYRWKRPLPRPARPLLGGLPGAPLRQAYWGVPCPAELHGVMAEAPADPTGAQGRGGPGLVLKPSGPEGIRAWRPFWPRFL